MKIFDSHCHIDDKSFKKDLSAMIKNAEKNGVEKMMTVGITSNSSERCVFLAEKYEGVYASVGVHPHAAKTCSAEVIRFLEKLSQSPKVKAWGETGLDFARMYSPKDVQEKWFSVQINKGIELGLPLIFHERESKGRFLQILKSEYKGAKGGVVHCFSGNRAELSAYLDMGLYIGVTGIITIKARGEKLRELVKHVPADRLLVETDAPYLTPAPEKNKHRRNEPAFVRSVIVKLAQVRKEAEEELAETVFTNTLKLYGID